MARTKVNEAPAATPGSSPKVIYIARADVPKEDQPHTHVPCKCKGKLDGHPMNKDDCRRLDHCKVCLGHSSYAVHDPKEDGDSDDPTVQWFVSIDNDHWQAVNRKPEASEYDAVVAIFASRESVRADGTKVRMTPMTFARRYVTAAWGGRATMLDPIKVE